jgi:asparagine synthase (glutamine-hydrolysing)
VLAKNMSAFYGVVNSDDSPVNKELLIQMRETASPRAPDGAGVWVYESVGLAHRLLMDTGESSYDRQPIHHSTGIHLVADCRIDNREELRSEFSAQGIWRGNTLSPDSYYVLLAYVLWGEEAPDHLLGDFAFAIWDERKHTLFCARDPIGLRSFVYHWDGRRIIFGTEIKGLLKCPFIPDKVNQMHLLDTLLDSFPNRHDTPFESILRLPAGHKLILREHNLRKTQYWNWHPENEATTTSSISENTEKLRMLLNQAIRSRMRIAKGFKVGSTLSGGIDSSTITSLASLIHQEKPHSSSTPFPFFTICYNTKSVETSSKDVMSTHEKMVCHLLQNHYALEPHYLEIAQSNPISGLHGDIEFLERLRVHPNHMSTLRLYDLIRQTKTRAILNGEGADECFALNNANFAASIKEGHYLRAFREFKKHKTRSELTYDQLAKVCLYEFVPHRIKAVYRRHFKSIVPPWLDPQMTKKLNIRSRLMECFRYRMSDYPSENIGIHYLFSSGRASIQIESMHQKAASKQIALRLPFLDLRVLKFCASLHRTHKSIPETHKFLLSEVLKGLLPTLKMRSIQKTAFTGAVMKNMKKYAAVWMGESAYNPHPILASMIRRQNIQRHYDDFFEKKNKQTLKIKRLLFIRLLWTISCVDHWLKKRSQLIKSIRRNSHEEKKLIKGEVV